MTTLTDSEQYYVRRQGRVDGPWSLSKLQLEAQLCKLARYHHLSRDGESWFSAADVESLFAAMSPGVSAETEDPEMPSDKPDADTSVAEGWYYVSGNRPMGPVSFSDLACQLRAGVLSAESLVWRKEMAEWKSAREIRELLPVLALCSAVPLPPRPSSRLDVPRKIRRRRPSLARRAATGAGVIAVFLCVPLVGWLGVIPIVLGAWSLADADGKEKTLALAAVAGGFVEFVWGTVTAVAVAFGVAYWFGV